MQKAKGKNVDSLLRKLSFLDLYFTFYIFNARKNENGKCELAGSGGRNIDFEEIKI